MARLKFENVDTTRCGVCDLTWTRLHPNKFLSGERNGSYSRNEGVFHTRYRIQPEVKSCIAHSFVVERFALTSIK